MTRIIDLSTGFSSSSAPFTSGNVVKNNYSATAKPTANDDSGDSYEVGSQWINVTTNYAYVCVDATLTAAIWRRIDMIPLKVIGTLTHDFSSTNVTAAAYIQLTASTSAVIKKMQIFYPDGDAMHIATGAAASEVNLFYVLAGGTDGGIEVDIPASTRLSMKLITGGATNDSGTLVINLLGEA